MVGWRSGSAGGIRRWRRFRWERNGGVLVVVDGDHGSA